MRKLYKADTPAEAHFIRGLLENEGISAYVDGECASMAMGDLPFSEGPSVCVIETADEPAAQALIEEYFRRVRERHEREAEDAGEAAASDRHSA